MLTNRGDETVWISRDLGKTWLNATGNLRAATRTVSQALPSALALIEHDDPHGRAGARVTSLVVGTVSGVYVTWTDPARLGTWTRLGTCAEVPLVGHSLRSGHVGGSLRTNY